MRTGIPAMTTSLLIALVAQYAIAQTPSAPELRDELLRMKEADQAVRDLSMRTPEERRVWDAVDAMNTARLKQIVADNGWPTVSLVGQDGASAAWILAQHADMDPKFQWEVLDAMAPLVDTGEAKASDYAYLWDRTHDPQRYGTQGRCVEKGRWEPREIEESGSVDARRAEVGLPPLSDYISRISGLCLDD